MMWKEEVEEISRLKKKLYVLADEASQILERNHSSQRRGGRITSKEEVKENARLKKHLKTLADEAELYQHRVIALASPGYPMDLLNAIEAAREEEEG